MEKLDQRLAAAAGFVREGTVAVDVGTDHGYLICSLIKNRICRKAYATDINEKPLQAAKKLIEELELGDRIETRLTDGLEGLPGKEIEEIIICGMGGETILGILDRCTWIKNERVHLILQPMSRADMLRRFLCEEGFRIDEEKAVEAEGHLYTVMSVYYDGGDETPDEIYALLGELPNAPDETAIKYMRWQARIQRSVAEGLKRSSSGKESALRYLTLADMIDEQADEMEKKDE